jgi:hypothetical protein
MPPGAWWVKLAGPGAWKVVVLATLAIPIVGFLAYETYVRTGRVVGRSSAHNLHTWLAFVIADVVIGAVAFLGGRRPGLAGWLLILGPLVFFFVANFYLPVLVLWVVPLIFGLVLLKAPWR